MYRELSSQLKEDTKRVLVLLGSRQVGKTTLLKNAFPNATYVNLEVGKMIDVFNSRDLAKISSVMGSCTASNGVLWILDEVQRLNDPGLVAKVIHDELPDVQLIISGSSALEIANRATESLAGRKKTLHLYPLTLREHIQQKGIPAEDALAVRQEVRDMLRYGSYPEVMNITSTAEKESYLWELADALLLKDVYYLNLVKNTKNLLSMLTLLAHQIGGQVNVTDIADRVGIARNTVTEYLEILKKTFIIFTMPPFTRKRRDEVGKMEKVYFYDLGVRNALVNDFSPAELRNDYGNMFENFVVSEVLKKNQYDRSGYVLHYWRTRWGSEVDLVLTKDRQCVAIEIKTRKGAITPAFKATYPEAHEQVVTMENVGEFLGGESLRLTRNDGSYVQLPTAHKH